jgi:uroporphyrin-III C-methyltransferase/precorrin-2 dehydrogenase/sirohydrochlorin ferrochelatase
VREIDGGPAILVIGDVVAHSSAWREANLDSLLSNFLVAAE